MTEEEMNKLADLIVDKILVKQAEYDAEFVKQMEQESGIQLEFIDAQKQMIEDEIVRLERRLQKLLNKEMYEDAARLVEQINNLKRHL